MRRMLGLIGAVALFAVGSASTAAAQASIWLGGGATIPTGEYKNDDGAKTGWLGAAGVNVAVGDQGLAVGANVMYGRNSHEGSSGEATNLIGYNGMVMYRFGDQTRTGVYLYGMAGVLNHQFDPGGSASKENDSKFGWGAGGGVDIPVASSVAVWVGSGYYNRSGTAFISLMAGLSIAVGGGN